MEYKSKFILSYRRNVSKCELKYTVKNGKNIG